MKKLGVLLGQELAERGREKNQKKKETHYHQGLGGGRGEEDKCQQNCQSEAKYFERETNLMQERDG